MVEQDGCIAAGIIDDGGITSNILGGSVSENSTEGQVRAGGVAASTGNGQYKSEIDPVELLKLRQNALLFEYKVLRDEIITAQTHTIQVTGIGLTATALILGTALGLIYADPGDGSSPYSPLYPLIFLVPLPILWICTSQISGQRRNIWRIASYIRVFIETKSFTPNWETVLYSIRESHRGSYRKTNIFGKLLCVLGIRQNLHQTEDIAKHEAITYLVAGLFCVVLCGVYGSHYRDITQIIAMAVPFGLLLISCLHQIYFIPAWINRYREEFQLHQADVPDE